jgi:hypothetical protein
MMDIIIFVMKISLSPDEFKETLISHHPNDPIFNDDVILLFGKRVCAGCLFAYPTALLTWYFLRPEGYVAIVVSIFLAIISQSRHFIHNRQINFFFRIIAGIAMGFGFGGLLWALNRHNIWAILLLLISAGTYAAIKYHTMRQKWSQKKF